MKLPGRKSAYIPLEKLTGYLLSDRHSVGRSKARFFRGAGFDESNVEDLKEKLLEIAHSQDVEEIASSPHGTKYVIDGRIETPEGRRIRLRTVWIIDAGRRRPRFVTAYPA